jgi:hypothetical protein
LARSKAALVLLATQSGRFATMEEKVLISSVLRKYTLR